MNRSLSISLDGLRFGLTIVVVLVHMAQIFFSSGFPNYDLYGSTAVGMFFLLSGFVISYVTDVKEKTASEYAIARLARLYSVTVPAILLSGLVWMVCSVTAPAFLLNWTNGNFSLGGITWFYNHSVMRFLAQSAISLSFLNQMHGYHVFPGVDTPIWTLGFEGPYYLFFGILLFAKGFQRIVLLLLAGLLFGWAILGLFPVWLAGVGVYKLTRRLRLPVKASIALGLFCLIVSTLMAANFPSFVAWVMANWSNPVLFFLNGGHSDVPNMWSNINYVFYYAMLGGSFLIVSLHCLDSLISPLMLAIEKPVRWCASHIFSIYLYHFPFLVLITGVTHYDTASRPTLAGVFLLDLLLCIALSVHTEAKKYWWKKQIRRIFDYFHKPATV